MIDEDLDTVVLKIVSGTALPGGDADTPIQFYYGESAYGGGDGADEETDHFRLRSIESLFHEATSRPDFVRLSILTDGEEKVRFTQVLFGREGVLHYTRINDPRDDHREDR